MSDFFQGTDGSDVESGLVHARHTPSDEFVDDLAHSIRSRSSRSRARGLGAVMALSGVTLLALSASGGIYASTSGSTSAKQNDSGVHLNQTSRIHRPDSSGQAQYGPVPVPPHPKPKPNPNPPPPPPPFKPPTSPGGKNPCPSTRTTSVHSSTQRTACPPSRKPSGNGNNGNSGNGGTQGGTFTPPNSQGTNGSGLPFTGLALWVPVAFGLALFLGGLVLRRLGRRREVA